MATPRWASPQKTGSPPRARTTARRSVSTPEDTVTHNTAVSPGWSTDPADYLAGSVDTVGDHVIGIGFDIGDLLNGESVTFVYQYAVAADPDDFTIGTGYADARRPPINTASRTTSTRTAGRCRPA